MRAVLLAAVASLAALTPAPPAQQISVDPFTNASGQHETAVEPDSFAFGRTVVSVFQVGRIADGGASGIGWATSLDGGTTWRSGVLPGLTAVVSDPVVAYDRAHDVWLAAVLRVRGDLSAIVVSRSRDGLSWSAPLVVAPEEDRFNHDKPWLACDNGVSSPFAGRCYAAWTTRPGTNNILALATSTDGGATWASPVVVSQARGSGWQPVTRPDGALVIPYEGDGEVDAVVSRDGGRSFSAPVAVGALRAAGTAGMRAPALPSAEADADGRIYVAWQDARFRGGRVNDLVLASSADGLKWSRVRRVPTWPDLDGLTHFVPGLAAGGGRIAIAFYVLRREGVAPMFVSSSDGGRTWSQPHTLATPQPVTAYPLSNAGRFLGDYISTSFADGGAAVPTFAAAAAPFDGRFHQGVFATRIPPLSSRGALLRLGAPRFARAGRRVTVTIPVRGPGRATNVTCTPRAGLVARRVTRSAARCAWRVGARARIRGAATVFSAEEEVTRRFTVRSLAAAPAVGEQRALVILATWGPQPWTREEVAASFSEAARLYRKSSFDQLQLRADVTPWLAGYAAQPQCPAPEHERIPLPLTTGPDAAAEAAGFHLASYDRVVYVVPKTACNWLGVGVGRQVMLNGSLNTYGFVHELGHTYGLAHAHGRPCRGCHTDEYGDPFSPMGRGLVDFSTYEKLQVGWLRDTPVHLTRAGAYPLGRPDVLGATPPAAVVETAAAEYWFEQRLDVEQPGLVVRTIEPDVLDDDLAPSTLFINEPTARGRSTVARGETFRVPGVFSLQYGENLRFAWLDRTRPPAPRVSVARGSLSWAARDRGSGIASCRVAVDGRTIATGEANGRTPLPVLKRGRHRVSVACVDRAGNRSRATVKRLRVR